MNDRNIKYRYTEKSFVFSFSRPSYLFRYKRKSKTNDSFEGFKSLELQFLGMLHNLMFDQNKRKIFC